MILVTGASGLLGRHLLRYLSKEGSPIRALYNHTIPRLLDGTVAYRIHWVKVDLLDLASLETHFESIRQVYHCAGVVSYDARHYQKMYAVNVTGTQYIVDLCLQYQVQRLVHVSSIAALGNVPNQKGLIDENSAYDEDYTTSYYGKTKKEAEMEVQRGIAEGLNAVIVNPSIILGEGDWQRSSTNLFKIVYDEFRFYTTGATGWVMAEDVARAMILLMNHKEIQPKRFIISAENLSYQEVFTQMANMMHKKPPYIAAPKWMSGLVWRWHYIRSLLTGKQVTITKETARAAYEVKKYDNQQLRTVLMGEFEFSNFKESIQRCTALMLK